MEKSGIRYSFEKLRGQEKWQVRINGQFIMYTTVKSADYVDQELAKLGYKSRQEVYAECVADTIAAMHGATVVDIRAALKNN
jgi:hypothetical protein